MTSAEAKVKFQTHTTAECEFAIRDIHATFAAQGAGIEPSYSDKLYTELDAARARLLELSKVRSRGGAVDLCHELAASLAGIVGVSKQTDRQIANACLALDRYRAWNSR